MGLSTQDLHHQKEHTRLYKIPKFGVNRVNIDENIHIQNAKIYKEIYGYFLGNFKSLYLAHHWPY